MNPMFLDEVRKYFNLASNVNIDNCTEDALHALIRMGVVYRAAGYKDKPLIVSAWRSPEHNKSVGGVKDSAHTTGEAFDISAVSSAVRFGVVSCALAAGFPRVGISRNFIHLDICSRLPHPVMFLY